MKFPSNMKCDWKIISEMVILVNTLRPRQNGHHFPDDILKHIFLNKYCCILKKISLTFVPQGAINNSSIRSDNGLVLARRQAII